MAGMMGEFFDKYKVNLLVGYVVVGLSLLHSWMQFFGFSDVVFYIFGSVFGA